MNGYFYVSSNLINDCATACSVASYDTNKATVTIQQSLSSYSANKVTKENDFSNGAKNIVKFENGKIVVFKKLYPCGIFVMPDIKGVRVIESNGEAKVVVVTFADGTTEKAVLSADDTYSLEYGISICVTKRLLDEKCEGQGNSVYNKIVRHGLKVYANERRNAEKAVVEENQREARIEKLARKKAAKRAKREAAAREYYIEIQKEAYLSAMKEFNAPTGVTE